ncbi:MAG TPA: adenylate cyclase regulatory domain-containing protein [Conexibacter sp.]|nr:adenylate cyclase regulatory domain-containing protein [Conexibacter sp.]
MDFAAEGLLDGIEDAAARADRIALLELLVAEGVELEELKRAVAEDRLVLLQVERALGTHRYTARDVAQRTGVPVELVLRHRQALGLPSPEPDEPAFTDEDVEAVESLTGFMAAGLPEDGILEVTRVLGEGLARVAATVRPLVGDAFLRPGDSERELSERYALVSEQLGPQLGSVMQRILNMHLREQLRSTAIGAAELASGRLAGGTRMTIAFADLVGFTKLGERVPAEELGAVAGRLTALATDVARSPVRLVKTIGDAAMLVAPEPDPLLEAAHALVEAVEAEGEDFPRLRAGLATGDVLGHAGDWYGSPVNLASRITAIARSGSVVTETATRQAADADHWRFSSLPPRRIKGVEGTVPLFRARPVEPEG